MTQAWLSDSVAVRLLGRLLVTDAMIEAVYTPPTWGVVPPWAVPLIGRRRRWVTRFRYESGPYAGQRAMAAMGMLRPVESPGFDEGVVPLGHLSEVAAVGGGGGADGQRSGIVALRRPTPARPDGDGAGRTG